MKRHTLAEAAARISTDPHFLERLDKIVDTYRAWHAWDADQPGRKAALRELKRLRLTAGHLVEWLDAALASEATPQRHALERLALAHHGVANAYRDDAMYLFDRLHRLTLTDGAEALLPQRRYRRTAPRMAAGRLRALLDSVGAPITATAGERGISPAVELLTAIAHAAGDSGMTPTAARDWLRKDHLAE